MNTKFLYAFLTILILICSIQKTSCQVLKYDSKIFIETNGRKTTEKTVLVQINDKQSNWLSHIEIKHNPKQRFSFNYARIIDSKGNILRKLKKKEISTRSDVSNQTFYQDDLITEFDLYWNQYPYRVEYSYTITEEEFLLLTNWTPMLYSNISTMESSLEINIPKDYNIHIYQSESLTHLKTELEDRKIYRWESSTAIKLKKEIFSPPVMELLPIVSVVPDKFYYGVSGSQDSWSSFGNWLDELNKGTDQLPLIEKKNIEKLIEGIEDKTEIIKKIYYYHQDYTKYINVAIDVGGLKSFPASYVYRNKYGDCKALTTYMKSLLKSVGIESFYTIIKAGKNIAKINRNFPSQQFNHVVLAVPVANDTIWLENTSNSLPYNYLGTFTQDRYALAINGRESELIHTPKLQPSDVLDKREYSFTINAENNWKGDIKFELRGGSFENFRYSISNKNELEQKMELIKHLNIEGFVLNDWSFIDYNRNSRYIKVQLNGDSPNLIREIGNWEVINPLKISIPHFEEPKNRHLDLRINYPINKSDKIVYQIKNIENKEITIPDGINIKTIYGEYFTDYSIENSSIICYEKFTLMDNNISLEKYPEFYSFIKSIYTHKKQSSILLK